VEAGWKLGGSWVEAAILGQRHGFWDSTASTATKPLSRPLHPKLAAHKPHGKKKKKKKKKARREGLRTGGEKVARTQSALPSQ
jgi:hypothetical protein